MAFHRFKINIVQPDIFSRIMKFSKVFLPYLLATAAGLVVDEGNECQPLVVINQLEFINFIDQDPPPVELASINISPQDDLYVHLLTSAK